MEITIIFQTVEGQTSKIASFMAERLRDQGHSVEMFNAADRSSNVSFDKAEMVILAASVHERRHPKDFEVLLAANSETLSRLPTMMVSVSLKASFPDGMEEAQDYLTEMSMRTGVVFDKEALVAGAVRSASYGYFESQIVHNVVLLRHPVDLVDGVREFTDWDRLAKDVEAFVSMPKEKDR